MAASASDPQGWSDYVAEADEFAGGDGWVTTEQIRTVSAERFRRHAPEITLTENELDEVRYMLAQMLIR